MSKHTPGPWKVIYKYEDMPVGCDGFIIESISFPHIIPDGTQLLGDEDADMQLMAAAPELLAALKEIVAAADGAGWEQLDASFSKGRAAIAKATGENHAE